MAVDGKVVYEVDYDTKKAKTGLSKLGTSLDNIEKKAGQVGSFMTKNVTAPMVALGGAAVAGFTKISAELDNIAKSAAGVGASAEGLQALQFAGRKAGVESDKMTDTLKKVQEIASQNSEAFWELGIVTSDMEGNMIDTDIVLAKLVDKMSKLSEEERNAKLLALGFTEELVTMNKLMEDSAGFAGNLETGLEKAIPDESIKKFEEFNDTIEDLKLELLPIGIQIAEELLPHLQDFADWLADDGIEKVGNFVTKVIEFTEENWKLIAAIGALGPALSILSKAISLGKSVSAITTGVKAATAAAGAGGAGGTGAAGGAAAGAGVSGGVAALGVVGAGVAATAIAKAADDYVDENLGFESSTANMFQNIGANLAAEKIAEERLSGLSTEAIYGAAGMRSSGVTISKVEVNTDTTLSPENQGQLVDDIMREVSNELSTRQVFSQ